MHANTIIVIPGPDGHEYVAEVGKNPVITPLIDEATLMSNAHARGVIAKMHLTQHAMPKNASRYQAELRKQPAAS